MTGRLKLLAAALGLVLATGAIADASATTAVKTHQVQTVKAVAAKVALKSHRLHVAHLLHSRKLHVAHRLGHHRIVKAVIGKKTIKEAGVATHRERHAMNHRVTTKPTTVVR